MLSYKLPLNVFIKYSFVNLMEFVGHKFRQGLAGKFMLRSLLRLSSEFTWPLILWSLRELEGFPLNIASVLRFCQSNIGFWFTAITAWSCKLSCKTIYATPLKDICLSWKVIQHDFLLPSSSSAKDERYFLINDMLVLIFIR